MTRSEKSFRIFGACLKLLVTIACYLITALASDKNGVLHIIQPIVWNFIGNIQRDRLGRVFK